MKIRIYIALLLLLSVAAACTDDTSTDQFFATVKFEYVPKNKKLTFKKVDVKSLSIREIYFLKKSAFKPKPDADGYFTVSKGRYFVKLKAQVTFTDSKGVERTLIFTEVNPTNINISESGIVKLPLENLSYTN